MSFVRGVMQEKIMEPIQSSTTEEAAAQTLRDYLQAFRSLRPSAAVSYFHLPFVLIADGAVGALAGAISLDAFPG